MLEPDADVRILRLIGELVDYGVPIDAAHRAIERAKVPGGLPDATEIALAGIDRKRLDDELLARAAAAIPSDRRRTRRRGRAVRG